MKTHSKLGVTIPNPSEDYLVYTALLNQTGVAAPTAIVLKNTLGAPIVWAYIAPGIYTGTLAGAFTEDKTWVYISQFNDDTYKNTIDRSSTNTVQVLTYEVVTPTDALLTTTSIEIRVYP